MAARQEEPDHDRLALHAPKGEVVVIEERGIVDAPKAAAENPERGQQQGEGDAAVGDRPEEGPERLRRELAGVPLPASIELSAPTPMGGLPAATPWPPTPALPRRG